jgi:hypothetical protein
VGGINRRKEEDTGIVNEFPEYGPIPVTYRHGWLDRAAVPFNSPEIET